MTDRVGQLDIDQTFLSAEQAGLKLAIKGRLIALALVGGWLIATRGLDRIAEFGSAVAVFAILGVIHHFLIGTALDRKWLKYLFLSIDILLLSAAVAFAPPTTEVSLPQIFMFRFDIFPYYFLFLGVAAFSFSPGLVLWAGLLGAGAWIGAFLWVMTKMPSPLQWSDIPSGPTKEQFLTVFLNENFVGAGSRAQEAIVYLVVAILIAIVMHRARQTVRRQIEAERDITTVSQLFGRFVPKVIADAMIKDQGVLDPVERQATVLFIDIAGFTAMTEAKGPRATVNILNAYFDAATEIIGRQNGVVTQFQGDAILAIFNVPFEDRNHARRGFDASLALLERVRNETFAGQKLGVRMGLTSGRLFAGNVGGGGRQSYTAYGDTVNLAARLESLNKDYGTSLLVAQSTAMMLQDDDLQIIGETDIRGLSEPIRLYALSEELKGIEPKSG